MGIALALVELGLGLTLLFQVIIPALEGRKLFPMFRKTEKVLDRVELNLNQQQHEAERVSELQQKAESIKNEYDQY